MFRIKAIAKEAEARAWHPSHKSDRSQNLKTKGAAKIKSGKLVIDDEGNQQRLVKTTSQIVGQRKVVIRRQLMSKPESTVDSPFHLLARFEPEIEVDTAALI